MMSNNITKSNPEGFISSLECGNECSLDSKNSTETLLENMNFQEVLEGNWKNLTYALSDWQRLQLVGLEEPGINCLLKMWFTKDSVDGIEGAFCNATWDNVYCWPPTPAGNSVTRECTEILQVMDQPYADQIHGSAHRICLDNGNWLWGNWTNYTQCADSYEQYVLETEEERKLVVTVQHILFIGSLLSFVCLAASLSIYYHFKCLWCDRVTIHSHLMIALMLRSALLIIITEPFLFNRTNHYRNEDFICKMVLSINFYATVASINWMFIQGLYLHGKLTTNVFDRETPFKTYYTIGWILPLILIGIYATVMEITHPVMCWKDYSDRPELWILLGPILFALLANLLFLINIMRILLTKVQWNNSCSDTAQLRRAIKATLVLFPLLGVNNLLFLYNPEGELNKYYVISNSFFGSTQGFFVAVLYCFVSRDVRDAFGREYHRFLARRSGGSRGNWNRANRSINAFRPPVRFRSTMVAAPRRPSVSGESSGVRLSVNTSMELVLVNRVVGSETPSPQPSSSLTSCWNSKKQTINPPSQMLGEVEEISSKHSQPVSIPLSELRYDY